MIKKQLEGTAKQAAKREGTWKTTMNPPRDFVDGEWQVAFSGKGRAPGNHFLVIINDDTGDVTIFPGH